MDNKEIIGRRISEIRKKFGYTQTAIGEYLGVDQSFISHIEKGERAITTDMLDKLTDLFGISFEDLYSDSWNSSELNVAFRATQLTANDMKAISDINRIALNCEFMQKIIDRR